MLWRRGDARPRCGAAVLAPGAVPGCLPPSAVGCRPSPPCSQVIFPTCKQEHGDSDSLGVTRSRLGTGDPPSLPQTPPGLLLLRGRRENPVGRFLNPFSLSRAPTDALRRWSRRTRHRLRQRTGAGSRGTQRGPPSHPARTRRRGAKPGSPRPRPISGRSGRNAAVGTGRGRAQRPLGHGDGVGLA